MIRVVAFFVIDRVFRPTNKKIKLPHFSDKIVSTK